MPGIMDTNNSPAPVKDSGAINILNDIYKYLDSQQSAYNKKISSTNEDLSDVVEKSLREASSNRKNSDRNNKIVNKALRDIGKNQTNLNKDEKKYRKEEFDKIDKLDKNTNKALSELKNGLLNSLSKLKDFIGENMSKSLKSFSDLAKVMRKANLSRADKDKIQAYSSSAISDVSRLFAGLQISKNEVNDYLSDLVASGKDLKAMSSEQRASFMALRKSGLDADKAYVAAMTASSKDLESVVVKMNKYGVGQLVNETLNNIKDSEIAMAGGVAKALNQVSDNADIFKSKLGMAGVATGEASKIISGQLLASTGQYHRLSEEQKNIASVTGGLDDMANALDKVKNIDTAFLASVGILDESWANLGMMQKAGVDVGQSIYTDEQVRANLAANTANGKVYQTFDKISSSLDDLTGGLLGKGANILDEYFGDSVDISQIVSKGFSFVLLALGKIISTLTSSKFIDVLSGSGKVAGAGATGTIVAKSGILSKLKSGARAAGVLAKGSLKGIPIIGTIAGAGMTIYDIYDAASWEANTVASRSTTTNFKEAEKLLNSKTKTAKIVGASITGASTLGAMAIGATIGSSVPIVGTAIGAAVGAGVGVISNEVTNSIEKLNDTKIAIGNIQDLKDSLSEINAALDKARDNEDAKKELLEIRAQIMIDLENATKRNIDLMISNFNENNKKFVTNSDAMIQIRSSLDEVNNDIIKFSKSLETSDLGLKSYWQNQLNEAISRREDLSQALTGLAGGEFTIKEGELIEEAVKRIAADVRGEGWFDTRENVEYEAAKSIEATEKLIKEQAIDKLTSGVFYEVLDSLKLQSRDDIARFIKESKLSAGLSEKATEDLTEQIINLIEVEKEKTKDSDAIKKRVNASRNSMYPFANGGIVGRSTAALIGEDGKEVVLPLTKPDEMSKVLNNLTSYEKLALLKTLISSSGKLTNDGLYNAVNSILFSSALQSGTQIGPSVLSNNIIAGAAAQRGKKYSEMVCNQLVEAALNYAGFKPPTTGIVMKHFHHPKMRLVLNDPINGISPTDKALVPGMILFSHPFTEEEAIKYNKGRLKPRVAGDPGHMGIYAGDGLWWNSTSSKSTIDYSSGKGIRVTDANKGFGVALTKPSRTGTHKLYAAGYYDGMFDNSVTNSLPSISDNIANTVVKSDDSFMGDSLKSTLSSITDKSFTDDVKSSIPDDVPSFSQYYTQNKLAEMAMGVLSTNISADSRQAINDYAKQAAMLLNESNSKEILSALMIIAKNTSAMASSVKKPITPVGRVPSASFM